jgi:hypothetical protein
MEISLPDISSMPSESNSFIDSFEQLLVRSSGISISHIIQDSHSELSWISGSA